MKKNRIIIDVATGCVMLTKSKINNYQKLTKSEPVDFQEPKAKNIKSDASDDIYYLETRSHSNHERVPISKS